MNVQPIHAQPTQAPSVAIPMHPTSGKHWLCVWLPNWPIQRVQAIEPALVGKPLVLSARDPRRGLVVATANLPARSLGVRPGMRLVEATGLAALEVRSHDPAEDLEALCGLAEQSQCFSPLVGLEQLDRHLWAGRCLHQPECLLLDISGLDGLFGGQANLLWRVGDWLRQQHYFGCLAVGSSVGAAWALANYALRSPALLVDSPGVDLGQQPVPSSPNSASNPNLACQQSLVPASRYLLLEPQQQAALVERLPLAGLRIDSATIATLWRLGLNRIGQLNNLPRAGLASRLGEQLLLRWDQARGAIQESIASVHCQPQWSVQQDLELPTDRMQTIAELVRRSVVCLSERLQNRGQGALRITCRLDLVQQPSQVLQLSLFRPTCDGQHLLDLLMGQLEQQLPRCLQAPLWRLSLTATLTAPLVWRQFDLFDSGQTAQRHQLAQLVDTLSARLGRKQVLQARVQRQWQPELAYTLQPLTGIQPNGTTHYKPNLRQHSANQRRRVHSPQHAASQPSRTTPPSLFDPSDNPRETLRLAEPVSQDPLRRPLQLLSPPVTIQVSGIWQLARSAASSTAAPAAQLKLAGQWQRIIVACGPERLESGWWKGPSSRRDYYRLLTQRGCWYWIYRDLSTGHWFLHGLFD
ncbi:MAG: DNA polymerase Y family protein [Pirellulaceae bacterium]|nr:DNA polymerase Y family protein [Pirellulaceae bacterium]